MTAISLLPLDEHTLTELRRRYDVASDITGSGCRSN